ncbi:MAG TPA: nucleotide disphospho-sugar-binding domain-containing protein [Pseudoduganella sp.]
MVGVYAPTGLLAARSLALPSASVGIGFYCPPPGRALPNLRPWEKIGAARLEAAEEHVLRTANAVLDHHRAPLLAHACDILLGDSALLCTWPELDHYGRPAASADWYGPNFLAHTGTLPHWPPGSGPKVFAYLKREHAQHAGVLRALADLGCRVLCYLPEVASGMAPPVESANIVYARAPVSLDQAMAEADLCVCHGGEATLVQALLAGVPLLMLPMQLEQFLICQCVDAGGAGINTARLRGPLDWRELVRLVLGDGRFRAAAQAFAARYAGFSQHAMTVRIAEQFERQLAI